jgi:hypothetical protein
MGHPLGLAEWIKPRKCRRKGWDGGGMGWDGKKCERIEVLRRERKKSKSKSECTDTNKNIECGQSFSSSTSHYALAFLFRQSGCTTSAEDGGKSTKRRFYSGDRPRKTSKVIGENDGIPTGTRLILPHKRLSRCKVSWRTKATLT